MSAKKERLRKRSFTGQKFKMILGYGVIFLVFAVIGAILSLNILFKVKNIEIIGNVPYSHEEILDSSKIKNGDNLFLIKSKKVKNQLERALPYIENVNVKKVFPNKCIINVDPVKKILAFAVDDGYALIDENSKLLEFSASVPESAAIVKGIQLENLNVGTKVNYKDANVSKMYEDTVSNLNLRDLNNVTGLDFSNLSKILVTYENRVNINFGMYEDMDYKIRTAKEIVSNKLGEKDEGTLDLSTLPNDNRSYFKPKNITQ